MSAPVEAPSGQQHTLVHEGQMAVVVEVGGALRSYSAPDREVLDGYDEDEMASSARGHPLIPWPNRVGDGRYTWDGEEHQLPLSEPESANAIHGLVRWANWTAVRQSTVAVQMRYLLHPQPGYPFTLEVSITYRLDADGLTVTTTARNRGTRALPYAAGQHPYLATAGLVDQCTLHLDARTYVQTDGRGLPVADRPVDGTGQDFRSPRPVGEVQLDTAFTDLARDVQGRAWVTLGTGSGRSHGCGSTPATPTSNCSPATHCPTARGADVRWASSR